MPDRLLAWAIRQWFARREREVRVDRDRAAPAVSLIADFRALPFAETSWDSVACDPPYGLSYPDRVRLQRELARVARLRLLFKAPWIPRATGWTCIETVLLASHTCANVAVLERSAPNGDLFE